MPNISQMAGTSPITLKAQLSEVLATANTATLIVQNQFGCGFVPVAATAFCSAIGAGAATLDVQVAGATIMNATIAFVANSAVAGTVISGTAIANATDISFIISNQSGGNLVDSAVTLTGYVTHTS